MHVFCLFIIFFCVFYLKNVCVFLIHDAVGSCEHIVKTTLSFVQQRVDEIWNILNKIRIFFWIGLHVMLSVSFMDFHYSVNMCGILDAVFVQNCKLWVIQLVWIALNLHSVNTFINLPSICWALRSISAAIEVVLLKIASLKFIVFYQTIPREYAQQHTVKMIRLSVPCTMVHKCICAPCIVVVYKLQHKNLVISRKPYFPPKTYNLEIVFTAEQDGEGWKNF